MQTAASPTSSGTNPFAGLLAPATPPSAPQPNRLSGKRVLITGAGGSIGSALAQAGSAYAPSSLILLDTSEAALYQLDRTLRSIGPQPYTPILGSVCDDQLLAHIFALHRPQIILHAAALKHVPLMEQNPFAAIKTNVCGTLTLAQTALAYQAEHLILVSTDKAVDPHSIMGASKRIAELILLVNGTAATRMSSVRLCNVIGSQGSVLPLFLDQVTHNQPLTVTHPDAQRYFISLDHAVTAIFAALQSPSAAAILIPDIPPPIRILDLAHHLLATHSSASPITFTGLRPGDKLTESLLSAHEHRSSNPIITNSTLYAIESPTPTSAALDTALTNLREDMRTYDLPHLLRTVQSLVPEYQPSPTLAATTQAEVHP
jgi:FlaA1/EpsC-like NDP-sugar epimerase